MRRSSFALAFSVAAASAVACAPQGPSASKLAAVEALPSPSLPPWIASISPTRPAETLAQIRVIFAKPVAPVTALSGAGPQDVLSHVSIDPALRGHFALLTPRMIGFVADQALPIGTRVRVTLGAGLHDLAGDALQRDVAWTFETKPLEFSNLPQTKAADDESTPAPVGLRPNLDVTANAAVDPPSLASRAALVGGGESVPLIATLQTQPTPFPGSNAQELFDPSLDAWVYRLRPARDLKRGTEYALRIDPGVAPAYGNLATQRSFDGAIRTYAQLAVVASPRPSPNGGSRFADGDPAIAFTNPLDPKSVAGAVTLSPAPSASVKTLATVSDQSNAIAIDPYALDPNATYTATVGASVKDVFGQTLGHEQQVTIRTSNFAPGAWAPSGTTVIPAGENVALNFYATNLPNDAYHAAYARVAPAKLLGSPPVLGMLPPPAGWPARTLAGARTNAQSVVRVPLREQLGGDYGALAYGFRTALDSSDSSPSLTGIVQLTNLGVFAQWFPAHGIVLVQHLSDGAPVRGARVTVFRVDEDGKLAPQQCASGTTDASGQLDLHGVDVERCSIAARQNQAPNLGVVVTDGADLATVTAWNYSGVSRFDVYGGWTSGAPLSRGTIFTDRQMYQPGERGKVTGIAYYVKGTAVVADANASYKVSLVDPSNASRSLGSVRTDAFGVFSLPIAFSKQQALGYYTLDAKGANGNDVSGSLRVAEFKPPNFKLTLTLGGKSATGGTSVRAGIAAAYLFGAPLQGGTARAYVTRDVATVQPAGWDDFSFGPQWYDPEPVPSFDTDVLQRDVALDERGDASLDVAVPATLPFPMNYRVDVETSDVSHLSVADSQSFLALPSDAVIGLASDTVGKAGTPMQIRTIVTDADGKAATGRAVHLELQKMTYTSATQEVEGGESAQQAIKYDTVATADVTPGDKPVAAALTPPDAGSYRVRANFGGARSDASATDIQVFAFGAGEADWGMTDPNAVAVKLDKKQYAIGDTATALIASPYDRADVYLVVVRGDAIYRTTLHDVSGAVHATFRVTQAMMPNAALQAVVVRRRTVPEKNGPNTLALTGMAAFNVDLAGRYLRLAIAPHNATVTPGGAQRVNFTVKERSGAPARGEVVAMVVNDAILQLSGYRLPDLVQTVFAAQPISTIFSDNRENVTLKTPAAPSEKGFGYGGGFLAGAANTRVRANFLPLAYYGVLKTDAAGRASAAFTMPDDLTTWRVMAVALAQDTAHFATADATFVSNQPLIANPLLPQFARPGDRFDLGVSIANQTGAAGALDLVMQLTGALRFAEGDPQSNRATEQAATGMQAFRFPVIVGTPAAGDVRTSAALGDRRDAFSVPFAASDRAVTDSVIESGATRSTATVPIALNSGGALQVTLANSVVPQFAVPAERVMLGDALPLADEAASRLTIAAALARLRGPYRLKLSFDPSAGIASEFAGAAFVPARRRGIRRIRERFPERSVHDGGGARGAGIRPRARRTRRRRFDLERDGVHVAGARQSGPFQVVRRRCVLQGAAALRGALVARGRGRRPHGFPFRHRQAVRSLRQRDADPVGALSAARARLERAGRGAGRSADANALRDGPLFGRQHFHALELARLAAGRAVADAAAPARTQRPARAARRGRARAARAAVPVRLADDGRHRLGACRADGVCGEGTPRVLHRDGERRRPNDRQRALRRDGLVADVRRARVRAARRRARREGERPRSLHGGLHVPGAARIAWRARGLPRGADDRRSRERESAAAGDDGLSGFTAGRRKRRPGPRRRRARDRRSSRRPVRDRRPAAGRLRGGGHVVPHDAAGARAAEQQLEHRHEPDLSRSGRRLRAASRSRRVRAALSRSRGDAGNVCVAGRSRVSARRAGAVRPQHGHDADGQVKGSPSQPDQYRAP